MSTFSHLLACEGVHEHSVLRSTVGFMAFHGGALEDMTDVIAEEAAERAGASCYTVVQPASLRMHIPSHRVDPADSPALQSFLDHVDIVITVHGYGRPGLYTTLLLGGQNRTFAAHVAQHLAHHLPHYDMLTDLDAMPSGLRGQHPANPVNRPKSQGVQIELPPRVRGVSPFWAHWSGPGHTPDTQALITGLVAAVATWNV